MTADAAAAEPVTSNDITGNDLAGEHEPVTKRPANKGLGRERTLCPKDPTNLSRPPTATPC